jgi:hypothetical protein
MDMAASSCMIFTSSFIKICPVASKAITVDGNTEKMAICNVPISERQILVQKSGCAKMKY